MKLSSLPWGPIYHDEITTAEWFPYAKDIGLDGVELMDGWFNPAKKCLSDFNVGISRIRQELFVPEIVERVKEEVLGSGHEICMLTVHNRFCRFSEEEKQEEVDHLRICMEVAREFGTNRLRVIAAGWPVEGKDVSRGEAMEACIDAVWRCVEAARQENCFLILENHPGLSADVESYAEIFRRVDSPHFGANLDCKNTRRVNQEPTEFLDREEILSRLMCLHVDNFASTPKGWNRSVSVEEGEVDIATVLRRLKAHGYDGWLSIEYGGVGIEKVARSAQYVRRIWGE